MRKEETQIQYAALPFRQRGDRAIEVLLITSRDTGRWLIPKGWPAAELSPRDPAANEAREEGGLVGRISDHVIGRYHYDKRLPDGTTVPCAVEVFAFEVERQMRSWPERDERRTRWFALQEAADTVQERELQVLIRSLAKHISG